MIHQPQTCHLACQEAINCFQVAPCWGRGHNAFCSLEMRVADRMPPSVGEERNQCAHCSLPSCDKWNILLFPWAHSLLGVHAVGTTHLSFLNQQEVSSLAAEIMKIVGMPDSSFFRKKLTGWCPEITHPRPADLFTVLVLFILFISISTDVMCTSCAHIIPCAWIWNSGNVLL